MKNILSKLFNKEILSRDQAKNIMLEIANEQHNEIRTTALITAYNMRSITADEMIGFRDAFLELAVPFDAGGIDTIDIVGTGGDGKNTFNISTLSCVVVAGAGYKVSKHGSYGVSSSAGSSDVLIAMGYEFTNERDQLMKQLEEANICFLHAPLFHPAMKAVVPIRKKLGMRSFFNFMGPLVNPVQPTYQLLGTFNLEISRLYQYILQQEDRVFTIAHALDGYDEVSLTGTTKIRQQSNETKLLPSDFGLPQYHPKDLHGGEGPKDAAKIFQGVLKGEGTPAQIDVVSANAGLAIHTIKPEQSLKDCVLEAKESIESGNALKVLKKLT